jgi:hypothetical protein
MPKKDAGDLFKRLAAENHAAETEPTAKPKGKGRGGKRSDPDYKQVGLYVNKNIHRQVMTRLAAEDGELSALVEDLLKQWLGE